MAKQWTAEDIMAAARGFQQTCVLLTAVDLNIFSHLQAQTLSAGMLAEKLKADTRAMTVLLDALAAMDLLVKDNQHYSLTPATDRLLTENSTQSILPALRHQANCHRRWIQLPLVVNFHSSSKN